MALSIVLVGDHPLWAAFEAVLTADDTVYRLTQAGRYMQTLMEKQPSLVLVDGRREDWARWTSVPKSSPATRRIPIVLLSDNAMQREQAAKQGADAAVDPQAVDVLTLIQTYARLPDEGLQQQLNAACQQPLPPLAQEGIARFNAGDYYKQHDVFEALWMQTPGPERDLYQGILQVGVAYYQIERGNLRGAQKMLQRALQWLRKLPPVCQGVDVADLHQNAQAVLTALETEPNLALFNRELMRPVRLIPDA